MPLISRGFSLAETLIAMAISAILLVGTSRFLPALQRQVLRQTQQQSLDNELWQRVYTVAKHLQRAGYCHGQCVGQPLLIASAGSCVIVRWDSNSNGVWESMPAATSDSTGFRLNNGALETRRGAVGCSEGGWEKMTNPGALNVTHFQITRQNMAGFSPEFTVALAAHSATDPRISAQAEYRVTGYNL
ncbi:prepilin peptidase-dependent protein [Klebsiella sp. I138]|uniref:prepilin peptidase-dependent protein n=1 Tax=Klebsiella sp. I138 TaxID=2755385 RepID=UPI003DA895FD